MGETLSRIFWKDRSIAVPLWSCLGVFFLLYFMVPYASGYNYTRGTIYDNVLHGYTKVEDAEWSFGYVIIPITMVMLWLTKKRFSSMEVKPSAAGIAIIIFSFLCYYAGFKANQKYIGYVSGHLLIAGMIIWFLGWKYFLRAFWLWVFAGMMWPWIPLVDLISFPLRKVAVSATVFLWNLCGADAIRNGTSIVSAGSETLKEGEAYSLQVAAACSGMRSLFALLMISLIFAYTGVKRDLHRFVVVTAMIPIAVAGNVVRISLLIGGTILWGNDFTVGTEAEPSAYHLGAGFAVYFVALFSMFVLVTALNGGWNKLFKRRKVVSRKVGNI